MIIMGNKKDKGGSLAVILKKIHQGFSSNNEKKEEYKPEDKPITNTQNEDEELQRMFDAIQNKDSGAFKSALKSFIKMIMHED